MKKFYWLFLIFISAGISAQTVLDASGSANTFNVTFPANLGGFLPAGMMLTFRSNQDITGAASLIVNGVGPKAIKKNYNTGLAAGNIKMYHFVTVIYDNINDCWQLMSSEAQPVTPSQWIQNGTDIYYPNNVGVGTTAPGKNTGALRYLTLSAAENAPGPPTGIVSAELQSYTNTTNSAASRIDFNNVIAASAPANHARISALTGSTLANGQLVFSTSNGTLNERMRITEAGRVGIGENNPLNGTLEVALGLTNSTGIFGNGNRGISLLANTAGIGFNEYRGAAGNTYPMSVNRTAELFYDNTADALRFAVSNTAAPALGNPITLTNRLILDSNGKLGLGAFGTNPNFDISFSNSGDKIIGIEQAVGAGKSLTITGGMSNGTDQPGGELVLSTGQSSGNAGSVMRFKGTNAGQGAGSTLRSYVDRMVIDANGNIGIGTSAPNSIFHIAFPQGPNLKIQRGAIASTQGDVLGALEFFDNQNGSNPQANIVFKRDAASSGGTDLPTSIEFGVTKDGTNTIFPAIKIDNSGDVGIGVMNPQAQLHSSLTTTSANYAAIRGETFGTGGVQALGGYSWARGSGAGGKALGFAAIADYTNTPTSTVALYAGFNSSPGTLPSLTFNSAIWAVGNGVSARAATFENGGVAVTNGNIDVTSGNIFVNTGNISITGGKFGVNISTIAGNALIAIRDGHLQIQQAAPPTGTGLTFSPGSSDQAGNVSFNTVTGSGAQAIINFNKSFNNPPIVLLMPTSALAATAMSGRQIYVTSNTTSFSIVAGNTGTGQSVSYNYWVIEP